MSTLSPSLIARAKEVDLPALAGRYTRLRRWTRSEYAGPCPFCGGRDRFHVQAQRWLCRKCTSGRWADAIAFERMRTGAGFRETVSQLANEPILDPLTLAQAPAAEYSNEPPGEAWQKRGRALVAQAAGMLWSGAGVMWRRWLRGRGITERTARLARLGCLPDRRYDPPEWWGLPREGDRPKVWLPEGLLIPCFTRDHTLWYLTIRRLNTDRGKYVRVRGHRPGLYLGDSALKHQIVVITEGELDALLVWQEVHHLPVGVATLGSATACARGRWAERLAGKRLLLALDADAAGRTGETRWLEAYPSAVPLRWPESSKDLTEYHQHGGNLAALIQAHL